MVREMNEIRIASEQKIVEIQHMRAEQEAEEMRKLKYLIDQERMEKTKLSQDIGTLRQQIFKLE